MFQKEYVSSSVTPLINARNTFTKSQCSVLDGTAYPIHLMIMDENTNGFTGVYDPEPSDITNLLDGNIKGTITGSAANDSVDNFTGRRRLLTIGLFNGTTFDGIKNPIVCLENGEFMLFAVNNNNYPVYDM